MSSFDGTCFNGAKSGVTHKVPDANARPAMRLRTLAPAARRFVAVMMALCVGVWLAMPPGFMPASKHGVPVIVPCPGSDGTMDIVQAAEMAMPAMPMGGQGAHHHGSTDAFHHVCQYAAAASLFALGGGAPPPRTLGSAKTTIPSMPALAVFHRHPTRDYPPAQGPPVPA